jgi:hypothetical protein
LYNTADYIEQDGVLHFFDGGDDYIPGSGAQAPFLPVHFPSPPVHNRKHKRSPSLEDPLLGQAKRPAKRSVSLNFYGEGNSGPSGISRAATHDRKMLESIAEGTFTVQHAQINRFLRHIRSKYDKDAELDKKDPTCRTAIHSVCGNSVQLDGPLRSSKFRRHALTCQSNDGLRKNGKFTKAARGCAKITHMFGKIKACNPAADPSIDNTLSGSASPTPPPSTMIRCRGLRPEHDIRVLGVIDRSKLGGKTSILTVAMNEYGKEFKALTEEEKASVRNAVTASAQWICHYNPIKHVRRSNCEQVCDPDMAEVEPADICNPCADLLHLRAFQTAMNRPIPEEKNLKFVPKSNRNKTEAILYGRYVGLKEIIEASVCYFLFYETVMRTH